MTRDTLDPSPLVLDGATVWTDEGVGYELDERLPRATDERVLRRPGTASVAWTAVRHAPGAAAQPVVLRAISARCGRRLGMFAAQEWPAETPAEDEWPNCRHAHDWIETRVRHDAFVRLIDAGELASFDVERRDPSLGVARTPGTASPGEAFRERPRFAAYERVEGTTLARVLAPARAGAAVIGTEAIVAIAKTVLVALAHLHAAGRVGGAISLDKLLVVGFERKADQNNRMDEHWISRRRPDRSVGPAADSHNLGHLVHAMTARASRAGSSGGSTAGDAIEARLDRVGAALLATDAAQDHPPPWVFDELSGSPRRSGRRARVQPCDTRSSRRKHGTSQSDRDRRACHCAGPPTQGWMVPRNRWSAGPRPTLRSLRRHRSAKVALSAGFSFAPRGGRIRA